MSSFSKLERDILATLEEAGEDHLSALLNTVRECRGSVDEIDAFRTAITSLIKGGFVDIAKSRDKVSRHWIPLPKLESVGLATGMASLLHWSGRDQLWNVPDGSPRLEVVLTNAGLTAAREVLSNYGWPQQQAPWAGDSH